MFKTPKDGSFKFDSLQMEPSDDYKIGPGDRFNFILSTNNGERIINGLSGVNGSSVQGGQTYQGLLDYLVRRDGTVELPVIGQYHVAGLSVIQLEDSLTKILSKQFQNPFVQIHLSNQRVVVFPGRGQARVVYLQNINTSLLEVIAIAGGISNDGFSNSIKVMRQNKSGKRSIFKIDLSTIEGIKQAEMIVQSNDYIYIDYKPRIASGILTEVAPWISLITTSLTLFLIFLRL
ncbi:MAG: polysaccharide biosynthesis/export family protein [Bacteroidota bacterium]